MKEETLVVNYYWIYRQACRLSHYIHAISYSFTMFDDSFELIKKRRLYNASFEFIN